MCGECLLGSFTIVDYYGATMLYQLFEYVIDEDMQEEFPNLVNWYAESMKSNVLKGRFKISIPGFSSGGNGGNNKEEKVELATFKSEFQEKSANERTTFMNGSFWSKFPASDWVLFYAILKEEGTNATDQVDVNTKMISMSLPLMAIRNEGFGVMLL